MKKVLLSVLALAVLFGLSTGFVPAYAQIVNPQTGTSYTVLNTDCSKIITFTSQSSIAVTLPRASSASGGGAASGQFMPPCRIEIVSIDSGTITVTPTTSTISGQTSYAITRGTSVVITSDGTNYVAQAGARF